MAVVEPAFFAPDLLERSVWVAIDPRDFVTGERIQAKLKVQLRDKLRKNEIAAKQIVGASGMYCFMDLALPEDDYVAQVKPTGKHRDRYFDAEAKFNLKAPPDPQRRNPVRVELLPKPAYPFPEQSTVARGRLVRESDAVVGVEGAQVVLILGGADRGRRTQTDQRGEFAVFFPTQRPKDAPPAGPESLTFRLRFELEFEPPFSIGEETVEEGTTTSLGAVEFPGI